MKKEIVPSQKIELNVVHFEGENSNVVIKPIMFDIDSIKTKSIRKWDVKTEYKKQHDENWSVLFDKMKDGKSDYILIALPVDELVSKFTALGIIEIVS
jgi:translation elongation factor EF-1alpha